MSCYLQHVTRMTNPKMIGERTEGMILAAILREGRAVLLPFGDNQRYDLVIDDGERFYRVQCKTAWKRKTYGANVLVFSTCSSQNHRGKGRQNYRGQIEFFGVYNHEHDRCFLIPVGDVPTSEATLRLTKSLNANPRIDSLMIMT